MRHARSDYDERVQDAARIIPDDEPVFLLRGQDPAASGAVLAWANEAERLGTAPATVERIRRWAAEMKAYAERRRHGAPDAPPGTLKP